MQKWANGNGLQRWSANHHGRNRAVRFACKPCRVRYVVAFPFLLFALPAAQACLACPLITSTYLSAMAPGWPERRQRQSARPGRGT